MHRDGKIQTVNREVGSVELVSSLKLPDIQERLTPISFKGTGGCIISGPESQQVYCFSSHDPEQMVDARDAEALLKTGLFCMKRLRA